MRDPLYPSLYQINTRVWLSEVSRALGRANAQAHVELAQEAEAEARISSPPIPVGR